MSAIEKRLYIAAPIARVWAALTVRDSLDAWMDDPSVVVDLRVGGRYQLFGGETTGRFMHIQPPNTLEYTWRQSSWREEWPDSLVRWELQPDGQGTQVHLRHSQFPNADERNSHDDGWDRYWLTPMKAWLEAG